MTEDFVRERFSAAAPFTVALAAGLTVTGCTAAGATGSEDPYADIASRMADYAESIKDDAQVPAVAIGIIDESGLVETRFLGENNQGGTLDEQTLFEIGSATKAFLGVTEALLVDSGDLEWEDRVVDHAPDFQMHDEWVTREFRIEDLIAQRSGLPAYAAETLDTFGHTWAENVRGLQHLEPETSFRSTFAYQNIPHYVAGQIVADKKGYESWNEAVTPLLLEPLGMESSGTSKTWLESSDNSTRGFTVREGDVSEVEISDFPSSAEGAGSIVSNLEDMSKWVSFHLNDGMGAGEQLLSAEQLQKTYTPLISVTDPHFLELVKMGEAPAQIGYATGWFVHSLPEGRVIEHGGNTDGYNAAVMFDPDRKVGLVVLSNQGFEGGAATPIAKHGMDLIQEREPLDYFAKAKKFSAEKEAEEQKLADEAEKAGNRDLEEYVGVYHNELLGTLDVKTDGDILTTDVGTLAQPAQFERKYGDKFKLGWEPGSLKGNKSEVTATFHGEDRPEAINIEGFKFSRQS